MTKLLVIAAGGTGGHMFPAQALAEAMLSRGWRVKLSTDDRGARYVDCFSDAIEINVGKSATFARGGVLAKLGVPFRILAGITGAKWRMLWDKPDVVVGFGGYPAIPTMVAAYILRVPRMIHEQNGVLGRVNAIFATRAHTVACGTWPTDLPDGVKGVNAGNPVRATVLDRAGAGYIPPGDYPMSILVMGGSQGAHILSEVVPKAIASIPEILRRNIRVAHQARAEDGARVATLYNDAGVNANVQPFFDDVATRMSEAQLVITRAGASTIADLTVIGRPAILVPFAAATGDHQTANARSMVNAGAAILMPESHFTPTALAEQIVAVLTNGATALEMAQASLLCGKPDATERLVELVEKLSKSK